MVGRKIVTKGDAVSVILVVVALIAIEISTGSDEGAKALTSTSNTTGSQNQTKMMVTGPNITGSISLGPTIAKAIASQVHVSLANASTIAEKAVGANAHAAAVRIGVVHGFLVWMTLVLDSNNNFHGVLIDPGNGKVLSSTPIPIAAMTRSGAGFNFGPGMMGPGPGMMGPGPGPGMMKSSGTMMGHP